MSIVGARIDSRLIHGQVGNYWTNKLGATRIMVIDDDISQNAIEKTALKMATPAGVKLSVLPVEKAAQNILAGKYDSQRVFIIANNPDRYLRLIEYGVPIDTINVGNLSKLDNTKSVTKSINVTPEQVEVFETLKNKGIKLTAQMVPTDPCLDFAELLEKAK